MHVAMYHVRTTTVWIIAKYPRKHVSTLLRINTDTSYMIVHRSPILWCICRWFSMWRSGWKCSRIIRDRYLGWAHKTKTSLVLIRSGPNFCLIVSCWIRPCMLNRLMFGALSDLMRIHMVLLLAFILTLYIGLIRPYEALQDLILWGLTRCYCSKALKSLKIAKDVKWCLFNRCHGYQPPEPNKPISTTLFLGSEAYFISCDAYN